MRPLLAWIFLPWLVMSSAPCLSILPASCCSSATLAAKSCAVCDARRLCCSSDGRVSQQALDLGQPDLRILVHSDRCGGKLRGIEPRQRQGAGENGAAAAILTRTPSPSRWRPQNSCSLCSFVRSPLKGKAIITWLRLRRRLASLARNATAVLQSRSSERTSRPGCSRSRPRSDPRLCLPPVFMLNESLSQLPLVRAYPAPQAGDVALPVLAGSYRRRHRALRRALQRRRVGDDEVAYHVEDELR